MTMIETREPNERGESAVTPPKERLLWYADRVLLPTIAAVLGVDQLSKYLIRTNLRLGESWPSDGLFRLTHGTNTGSAFGLFPNQTAFLIVASVIAIGFLVYFYRTHALPRPLLRFAIALQLGGALGNLLDRLRTGEVVDFIDLGPWPIFNLADSSIVVGISLLVGILVFRNPEPQGRPEPDSGSPSDSDSVRQ